MHDQAKRGQVHGVASLWILLFALTSACAGGDAGSDAHPDGLDGPDALAQADAPAVDAFLGQYRATWSATATITSPAGVPSQSYTDTGTIKVSAETDDEILMAWTVGSNAPSGTITFAVTGNLATATGIATGGTCWTGRLTNGNQQTTCATSATAELDGDVLVQHQTGQIRGTTPAGVEYTGTYEGTWTGTRIR